MLKKLKMRQEEEQLDALLEDAVVPEELEDDFDPMRA